MTVYKMRNAIQKYAWGSKVAIPNVMGRTPDDEPEAEVWMGSHPKAPSSLEGVTENLLELIGKDPDTLIGHRSKRLLPPGSKTPQLPFLFKILAAERGLSIQAHPTREHAGPAFEKEEARGIDLLAPNRNYRDRNHKPELIYAITDFYGMAGFRDYDMVALEMNDLLHQADEKGFGTGDTPAIHKFLHACRNLVASPEEESFRLWFSSMMELLSPDASRERPLFSSILRGYAVEKKSAQTDTSGRMEREDRYWWTIELLRQFPDDPGALAPLYLNLFHLVPGEALFQGAGLLHAYLHGTGVEIMANSDNVLRAGCTVKHVDPEELQKVVTFTPGSPGKAVVRRRGSLERFVTPAEEFELLRLPTRKDGGTSTTQFHLEDTPAIVLALNGDASVSTADGSITLKRGESAFVTAAAGTFATEGTAELFIASLPGGVEGE